MWTRVVDAELATRAGLSSGAYVPNAAPEAITGPGLHPEAPTGAGSDPALGTAPPAEDPDATRLGTPGGPPPKAYDSPSGPLSVGQPFGPRYHIVRLLGIGGMGAVYQAWDTELGVVVAVKVIRPEVAADPSAAAMLERRFKQELLLARQVTHKNVVRIHELGEIEGIKFITMPFIEGEELATILRRGEKLPIDRVLTIARGIATGLEAAHAAGVVHRDLKPANIMIEATGEPMIMDFGVARSTGTTNPGALAATPPPQPVWAAGQTMAGAVVGTVEYMAPEQAKAQAVDQRADIYALGLILYDMLARRPRVKTPDMALPDLSNRMKAAPPPLKTLNPEIPAALDRIVQRCLEPDPANRYQSTRELATDLGHLDDFGNLIRVRRVVGLRAFAAVVLLGLMALGLTWWFARVPAAPVTHDPVSVVIADIQNLSKDSTFDGTLEPMLKIALEGAGFISAYDRNGIRRTLGVRTIPEQLDESAARQIAIKEGVGVVVSGAVERQGSGYNVSIKATQAVTGEVITTARERASSKDRVLAAATNLAVTIREALGDDTSDAAQRFAMDTLSATSLDVVSHYAAGVLALSNGRSDEALGHFSKSVEVDPNFGIGYQALATVSQNLDRYKDAEKYINEALRHIDSMTPRERYRTRGLFYALTGDYQACVNEYGDLIGQFSADVAARNNLAFCSTRLRNTSRAVGEMSEVVKILPKRALYRENLATYSAYGGDFAGAEREARSLADPGVFGLLPLAFAQIGQGQLSAAMDTYRQMEAIDVQGASYAAAGLGDLALYEGRFSEAASILRAGALADLKSGDLDRAAAKYVALAYGHLSRGQKSQATDAALTALKHSQIVKIRFLAARILVGAGDVGRAKTVIAPLASDRLAEPQAHARIIEGLIALENGDPHEASRLLSEANKVLDTWIGRFDLGRALLQADQLIQADSEFDRCIARRGETLSLFLDEEPTYAYFPSVFYYQGRVREALKSTRFAESYRAYLSIREKGGEDPLLPEVRRRVGS